jgi:hypothetical protein
LKADSVLAPVDSSSGRLRAGEPQVFVKTTALSTWVALSQDGRWLAYADVPAGVYEVHVRAFPDKGTDVQISNAGGVMPMWSPRHRAQLRHLPFDRAPPAHRPGAAARSETAQRSVTIGPQI